MNKYFVSSISFISDMMLCLCDFRFCWIMSAYKHFAYFFLCPVDDGEAPVFVSLTDKPCGNANNRVLVNKIAEKPTGKAGIYTELNKCIN